MQQENKPTPDGFYETYYSYADIVYLVKANRIGRGYSAAELSFLIGRSKDYVAGRELAIPQKEFTVMDMYLLSRVFHQVMPFNFFLRNPQEREKIRVKATVIDEGSRLVHRMERKRPAGEHELLFQLYEYDAPPNESAARHDREQLERLRKFVGGLLRRGWFQEPRTPLEVFLRCCGGFKRDFRPRLLEKVLGAYMKPGSLLLEKRREKGQGICFRAVNGKKKAGSGEG